MNCIGFDLSTYHHSVILGFKFCDPMELFGAESHCMEKGAGLIFYQSLCMNPFRRYGFIADKNQCKDI